MKHQVIIGIEVLLLLAIIFSFILSLPSIARSQNYEQSTSVTEVATVYQQALVSPYARVATEIKDPKMASFFNELVTSMELDKPASVSNDQPGSLANAVPDISKIQKTAMNTPLIAAGKGIQDKEIADFYQGFLKQCGVTQ